MSLTTRDILERTDKILGSEVSWTHGVLARDRGGKAVAPTDPAACKWCLAGALSAAAGRDGYPATHEDPLLDEALTHLKDAHMALGGTEPRGETPGYYEDHIVMVNDDRRYPWVKGMLRYAIEAAS